MPSFHFVAVMHCVGLMKPNAAGGKRVPAYNAHIVECRIFDRSQLDLVTNGFHLICVKVLIGLKKINKKITSKSQIVSLLFYVTGNEGEICFL